LDEAACVCIATMALRRLSSFCIANFSGSVPGGAPSTFLLLLGTAAANELSAGRGPWRDLERDCGRAVTPPEPSTFGLCNGGVPELAAVAGVSGDTTGAEASDGEEATVEDEAGAATMDFAAAAC
jgi:hypothetical protein